MPNLSVVFFKTGAVLGLFGGENWQVTTTCVWIDVPGPPPMYDHQDPCCEIVGESGDGLFLGGQTSRLVSLTVR